MVEKKNVPFVNLLMLENMASLREEKNLKEFKDTNAPSAKKHLMRI